MPFARSGVRINLQEMQKKLLISLYILFLFAACSEPAFYEEFRQTGEETWHMDDVLDFPVQVDDTSGVYRLIFTIRNTTDYAYSNLYLFFTTITPAKLARRDTVELRLADLSGRWMGKGFGKIRESSFLIKDQYSFPDTGNYIFRLQHAMREENLMGITDAGIRIEKMQ